MHRIPLYLFLTLIATGGRTLGAQQRSAFAIGDVVVAPGTVGSGYLRVLPAAGDTGTAIPFSVMHGVQPGPVVAIVAGIHGSEYAPILAVQALRRQLIQSDVRGTVILVHCANPPSFFARTVYYGPADWQNLNRVFPGSPDGTLSHRIADALIRRVIAPADILIDVHAGDANEALMSYVAIMLTGDSASDSRSRTLGEALGFARVFETVLPSPIPSPARYLTRTASSLGKVSLAIESGELGRRDDAYVRPIVDGLTNLLRAASVLPGRPRMHQPRERYAENRTVVSPVSGVLWPRVKLGQRVQQGDTIATVTDLHGAAAAAILSPANGVIMYHAITPPIMTGETVAAVGIPRAK